MGNFKEDIAKVEAMIFDVDGVMTDGSITPLMGGDFTRTYFAKDGYALAYALRNNYKICVISGGYGTMLETRLKMIGIKHFYINCMDKITTLNNYLKEVGVKPENALYMGDDIPDLECMKAVGVPVCPADAASEVVEASRYVSQFDGGRGCVRDVIEQVLRAHGDWAKDCAGVHIALPASR